MGSTRSLTSIGISTAMLWLAVSAASAQPGGPSDEASELFSEPDPKALPSDAPQPDAEKRARASERFREGQAAFTDKRYPVAAEAFEQAFVLAPHHAALWNAARAREMAGQKKLAANHYQRFLDTAPEDARGRPDAEQSLEQLAQELGRLDIVAVGAERITVDGDPIHGAVTYVATGEHRVIASFQHGTAEATIIVPSAGARVPVRLTAPQQTVTLPGPLSPEAFSPANPQPEKPEPAKSHDQGGWSPIVIVVGGVATLAFAGTGIWSAVDGQKANDAFDAEPSEENKKARNRVNFRTVTVLGVATAAGILTTIAAIWLVDWGSDDETTSVVLTPGGVTLGGRF